MSLCKGAELPMTFQEENLPPNPTKPVPKLQGLRHCCRTHTQGLRYGSLLWVARDCWSHLAFRKRAQKVVGELRGGWKRSRNVALFPRLCEHGGRIV